MIARYNSPCPECGGGIVGNRDEILKGSTGKYMHAECAANEGRDFAGECEAEIHAENAWLRAAEAGGLDDWAEEQMERQGMLEYERGMAEVAQIQAISAPGSELREALYMEMELAAYNRGED